jgi:hypothetical protein
MRRTLIAALVLAAASGVSGCSSAPAPGSPASPPISQTIPERRASTAVSQAADSVGAIPGSANALFVYKFRMTDPPSGTGFSWKDRDLSFSFRPSPNALYFGVENIQGRPVQIDWDRSEFREPSERMARVGHSTTRWRDRFSSQAMTTVNPGQRYSDYVFSIDDLLDPGNSPETQLRRPLLPEDSSAPTYANMLFGVDLVFIVEGKPRTYAFRFQVDSVIPR